MKKKIKAPVLAALPAAVAEELVNEKILLLPGNGNNKKSNGHNGKTKGHSGKANGSTKHKSEPTELFDELNNRELLKVLTEWRHGNFSYRMPIDKIGLSGKICDTLNEIISLNETLVEELTLARKTIGKQGHLSHRVSLPKYAKGSWRTAQDSINSLISDLVHPTIEIAHVISSVAKGNLSQEMPLKIGEHVLQGEFAKIAAEVNDMVKQLNLF